MACKPRIAQAALLALSCSASDCAGRPDEIGLSDLPARADGRSSTTGANPRAALVPREPDAEADAGPSVCAVEQLVASPQSPDMMVVLDRSSSMEEGGRWRPSVSAVRRLTMTLEGSVRFGLTLFPGTSGGGLGWLSCLSAPDPQKCQANSVGGRGNSLLCTPGEVVVPVAARSAAAIATALNQARPSGGTPTSETLKRLVDSYADGDVAPDAEVHAKYVLLVTDGAPTCPAGNGTETTQSDIDATNAAIEALHARGARTYVIGYNTQGPGNEMLESVLDGFAVRGGTGDQHHRPVEDEASLQREFQTIASSITSCDFQLDKAPPRPEYVYVQLDDQALDLNARDGFKIVGGRTIQLVGAACERFRNGSHHVSAEIRCVEVVPG